VKLSVKNNVNIVIQYTFLMCINIIFYRHENILHVVPAIKSHYNVA